MKTDILNPKEGKAKKIHFELSSNLCKLEFKDSLTAFNGKKKEELSGKGALNASISAALFAFLNQQKIKTHFCQKVSADVLEVMNLKMIPLEVIVRNYSAGSFCKRLGLEEGCKLKKPLIQFHYKSDELNDPLLSEGEISELEICSKEILNEISNQALIINWLLQSLFAAANICLVDFKLEFGLDEEGNLVLGDELSPDNMRLWNDFQEGQPIQRLDKDRFRLELGFVLESYQFILDKLEEVLKSNIPTRETAVSINLLIKPQPGLLDPTGRTLTDATNRLGFREVVGIRSGKLLEIELKDFRVNLIEELCERILVSPASETMEYRILP